MACSQSSCSAVLRPAGAAIPTRRTAKRCRQRLAPPVRALADMAAATAGLAAAAFPKVALGGLAAAALSSLAPSPPAPPSSLRKPVAPGLEGGPVPLNTHGVGKAGKLPPFEGRILEIERMGGRDRERDVSRIVIDTGGVQFREGQSFGVCPPGTKVNSRGKEVPETVRLYSIASSRYGDRHDGKTCTLAVVRVFYDDPETGEHKRGLCSNFLCDRKVGDVLTMTGPAGTAMLLPEDHMTRPIVCVATGTGIAPFRSFWRRLFFDQVPGHADGYQGKFWLLAGFANPDSELFTQELRTAADAYPARFRLDVALSSRKNKKGGLEYVQDLIEEDAGRFLDLMFSEDALFYFCGLKRMYSSTLDVLGRLGGEQGRDVQGRIKELKAAHRWHVEVV